MAHLRPLKKILPIDQIPDELSVIQDGLNDIFSKLYYKNHRVKRTTLSGPVHRAFTLVSKTRLAIEIQGGDGLALVMNPGYTSSDPSEFNVRFGWQWILKQMIRNFDLQSFDYSPSAFFDIIKKITSIDEPSLLKACINTVYGGEGYDDPIQNFIDDFHNNYTPTNQLTHPGSSVSGSVDNLVSQLNTGGNSFNVYEVLFDLYISDSTTELTLNNLETVFVEHSRGFSMKSIRNILIPQYSATLDSLNLALEFPRSLLVPVDANGEPIEDENVKSKLTFNVGSLSFDTKVGFSFDQASTFNLDKSEILGTGFILEATGIKLDLSEGRNIYEANADGRAKSFKGIYLETAVIEFPKEFQDGADANNSTWRSAIAELPNTLKLSIVYLKLSDSQSLVK